MKVDSLKRKERAFAFLIVVVKVTMLMTWLPLIRGLFDGNTYKWGLEYLGFQLGGIGTGGNYFFLVLINLIALATIYSAHSSSNRGIFYSFLTVWLVPFIYLFIDAAISGDLILYGDSLGIAFNLGIIAIPFVALTISCLVLIYYHESMLKLKAPVFTWNKPYLALLLGMLPIQFVLFRIDTYGVTDMIGVILTIAQCLFITKAFKRV